MPTNTTALRQKRHQLIGRNRELLDKAEDTGSAMTAEENREYERNMHLIEQLGLEIQEGDAHNAHARAEEEKRQRAKERGETVQIGSGSFLGRDSEGREYRSLKHGESFAEAVCLPEELRAVPPNCLGRMIVSHVTGRWDEETRDYFEGSGAGGGFLVSQQVSATIIDKARSQAVISRAGAQTLPCNTETLKVARVDTDPVAYWTAERAEITESEGTFGAITLRPRFVACYCEASMELLRDAPNASAVVENTISKTLALGLDEACLNGPSGSAIKPVGLLSSTACDTLDLSAASIGYDKLIEAAEQAWQNDVEPTAMIYDGETRGHFAALKDGNGQYQPFPPALADYKRLMSNQINSTSTGTEVMYLGDFQNCLIGLRSGIEIEASGVSGDMFKRKMVAIRGLMRADFAVARNNDVVRIHNYTA
jgi:HK97 family phage major capsid protein